MIQRTLDIIQQCRSILTEFSRLKIDGTEVEELQAAAEAYAETLRIDQTIAANFFCLWIPPVNLNLSAASDFIPKSCWTTAESA